MTAEKTKPSVDERVAVLTSIGRTAQVIESELKSRDHSVRICASMTELVKVIKEGCGTVILIPEDIQSASDHRQFVDVIKKQPQWSALPVLLYCSDLEGLRSKPGAQLVALPGVRIRERPLLRKDLGAAVDEALRTRCRQYQTRDTLEALAEADRSATNRSQRLEHLTRSMAHDLRTPLQSIAMTLELLEQGGAEAPKLGRVIARAKRSTLAIEQMIEELMAYVRLSDDSYDGDSLEPIPLVQVVKRVIEHLQYEIERRGARVNVDILPVIRGQDVLLRQVFQNLIVNALKYNRSKSPQVWIWSEETEGFEVVYFRDNGNGIAEEDHEAVFEMFERRDRDTSGSGLGLALCREAMQRHNGEIKLHSSRDKGTTFALYFPRSPASHSEG